MSPPDTNRKPAPDAQNTGAELAVSPELLVIVDMQEGFPYSRWILAAVLEEIARARQLGIPILVIEYRIECAGSILPEIHFALQHSAAQVLFAQKTIDDGSDAVLQ